MLRAFIFSCIVACCSAASAQWFDNESLFTQSLSGPYYHEGFDSFVPGTLYGQTSWESPYTNTYKFQMYCPASGPGAGLMSRVGEVTSVRSNAGGSLLAGISTTFHVGTTPLVHAFGVRLKITDSTGAPISGTVKLQVLQDVVPQTPLEYIAQVGETGIFLGLHSTPSLDQAYMVSMSGTGTKVVVDDIYMGQPVPEPAPILATATALAFLRFRFRRKGVSD